MFTRRIIIFGLYNFADERLSQDIFLANIILQVYCMCNIFYLYNLFIRIFTREKEVLSSLASLWTLTKSLQRQPLITPDMENVLENYEG